MFESRHHPRLDGLAAALTVLPGFALWLPAGFASTSMGLAALALLLAGLFRHAPLRYLAALSAHPVSRVSLLLLLLMLIGLAYGPTPLASAWSWGSKYLDLLFLALIVTQFSGLRWQQRGYLAFAAGALLTLAISWLLWLQWMPFGWLGDRSAANPSAFKLHLTHGILMAYASFFGATIFLRSHSPERIFALLLALAGSFNVLVMIPGRTGQLLLAVLLLYLALSRLGRRALLPTLLAGGLVAALLYSQVPGFAERLLRIISEAQAWQHDAGATAGTSIGDRLDFYSHGWQLFLQQPWFGSGTGSFAQRYAALVAGTSATLTANPHNEYLLLGVQYGLIGPLVLIALFVTIWRAAARLGPIECDLARGLVLCIAIGSLFNSLLLDHTEGLFFAWLLGMLFARGDGTHGLHNGRQRRYRSAFT